MTLSGRTGAVLAGLVVALPGTLLGACGGGSSEDAGTGEPSGSPSTASTGATSPSYDPRAQREADATANLADFFAVYAPLGEGEYFSRPEAECIAEAVVEDPGIRRLQRAGVLNDELHRYFRDTHDDLHRVVDQVTSDRELLNGALEANLTQVSVRQNEDMRKISAWVAIAAVPTLIAGIYGMNFKEMPELQSKYGYYVVLGVIASIMLFLYRTFKKSGWL